MKKQRKKANKFIKKYKLTTKSFTLDHIKSILKAMGFTILSYNRYCLSDENVHSLLTELDLLDYSTGKDAFTYISSTGRIVFYNGQLSDDELLYILIHEIGHIVCEHNVKRSILAYNDIILEKEANEFAFYVYEYVAKSRAKKVCAVCAAVFLSAVIFSVIPRLQAPSPDVPKTHMENGSKNVYITKSGECYHNSWCSYVTGKSNIVTLTLSEADSAGYSPCFYCKPDITD